MGLLKDLGFKKRNGAVVAPDSMTINGKDIAVIRGEMNPPVLVEDTDSISTLTTFPQTITQQAGQDNWIAAKVEATGLSVGGVVKINGVEITLNTQQIVNTNSLAVTLTGTATSIKITPYVLN